MATTPPDGSTDQLDGDTPAGPATSTVDGRRLIDRSAMSRR
jgi:hypothetical protein